MTFEQTKSHARSIKSNFFVYQNFLIKIERGFELDLACPKMHNVSEITSMNSMSNLRFAEHMGGADRRFADLLRGLTFNGFGCGYTRFGGDTQTFTEHKKK